MGDRARAPGRSVTAARPRKHAAHPDQALLFERLEETHQAKQVRTPKAVRSPKLKVVEPAPAAPEPAPPPKPRPRAQRRATRDLLRRAEIPDWLLGVALNRKLKRAMALRLAMSL